MNATKRPPIPEPTKRLVRQRCGFGCVICGFPIYEYDHIVNYANTRSHQGDGIALLCGEHHDLKTKGLLTVADVKEANAEPMNLRGGESRLYNLGFKANDYVFDLGTVQFSGPLTAEGAAADPIRIDGSSVIGARVEDGQLLMSLVFCDDSGREVFRVKENELRYNKAMWDVEFVGKRLKIRERARRIVLDIEFEPPNRILVRRGRILRNGIDILVTEEWTAVLNGCQLFKQVQFKNCDVGIRIGKDSREGVAGMQVDPGPRDDWDRKAAVQWAKGLASDLLVPMEEPVAWL